MRIEQIDKNMLVNKHISSDVEWFDALDAERFSLHGVYFEEETKRWTRLPSSVAAATNKGVEYLAHYTAGGRLCFKTDSPYLAPEPVRGRRNDPRNVSFICEFIAGLRGMDAQTLCDVTRENGKRFYRI